MSVPKSTVEYPSDREMVFTRVLAAPRELVWSAWTDPEQVILWWGPKGFTTATTDGMEVKPGGRWRFMMYGADGVDYPNLITYHEVRAPERLAYDHGDFVNPKWFAVTVDFIAEGKLTKVVIHMTFNNAADCENAKKYGIAGHHSSMERLDTQLAEMANADHEIVLSRVFQAPRALVWQALTDPRHVTHWWGPRGFRTSTDKMDFRVGGSWAHVMIGPDGTRYPNKSVYKEIVPLERVVYSHGGGSEEGRGANFVATWSLEDAGPNRTRLTVRQVFPSAEMREHVVREYGAVEGGKQTFVRLAEHLPTMLAAAGAPSS